MRAHLEHEGPVHDLLIPRASLSSLRYELVFEPREVRVLRDEQLLGARVCVSDPRANRCEVLARVTRAREATERASPRACAFLADQGRADRRVVRGKVNLHALARLASAQRCKVRPQGPLELTPTEWVSRGHPRALGLARVLRDLLPHRGGLDARAHFGFALAIVRVYPCELVEHREQCLERLAEQRVVIAHRFARALPAKRRCWLRRRLGRRLGMLRLQHP